MSANSDFSNCQVTTCETFPAEEVRAVWELKGCNYPELFEITKSRARCGLELDGDEISEKIKINLHLKSEDNYNASSLCMDVVSGGEGEILAFSIKTEDLSEDRKTILGTRLPVTPVLISTSKDRVDKVVARNFLPVTQHGSTNGGGGLFSNKSQNNVIATSSDLILGITVTRLQYKEEPHVDILKSSQILSTDLQLEYEAESNFADLKLKFKDGTKLKAHKFILAARSPVLKALILSESDKDESLIEILQINDFSGPCFRTILHWMYTGGLDKGGGDVIEEVMKAAEYFQLENMQKLLDKKLVTVCNTKNMFTLYEAAKRHDLSIAQAEIKEFIKEHIE